MGREVSTSRFNYSEFGKYAISNLWKYSNLIVYLVYSIHMGKNIRLFNLFSFFSSLDFYIPIKVVYFHQVTNSYSTASTIISAVWIFQALLEVPTGIFSDLIGRRKTIILGAACSVIAYALYATSHNFWLFILGSFFEGASRSFFSGNNNAYLHNLLSDEQKEAVYHHYYGKLNSVMGVAGFAAALGSGVILGWSLNLFMWINLIPQVVAFILSLGLAETKHQEENESNIFKHLKDAVQEIRGNINLRYLSLSEMLGGSGLAAYEYQAAVYAAVWPTWAIGVARAIQEGGVIPGFYFAGKIIDRLGLFKVVSISWITSVLGNILAGLAKSVFSPIFIMLSLPLYGASDTATQKILQKEFTDRQRATIASLNSLGNSVTFSIALYLTGLIANSYGPFVALLATQVFLIPSSYFKIKFLARLRKNKEI